jgi:hypothetical protein
VGGIAVCDEDPLDENLFGWHDLNFSFGRLQEPEIWSMGCFDFPQDVDKNSVDFPLPPGSSRFRIEAAHDLAFNSGWYCWLPKAPTNIYVSGKIGNRFI